MGKGLTAKEAMEEVKQVVEGVYSAKAVASLAEKYNVDMPIVEQINDVLFKNKTAKQALDELFERDRKMEYSCMEW